MPTPFEENGLQAPQQGGHASDHIPALFLAAVFLAAFLVVHYGNALLLRLHGHLSTGRATSRRFLSFASPGF